MRASNGGHSVDRHFELALRPATPKLRALSVRYYISPPGDQPAGLPVVYATASASSPDDAGACPFVRLNAGGRAPRPRVLDREPDRIVARTARPPGAVVVADLAYPGWKVSLDGKPARALVAGDLRAVQVPAGARRVTWVFTPPGVRAGAFISLAALLAVLAVALVPWWRSRRS